MKHFFNSKDKIVTEAIDGLLLTSAAGKLARLDTYPDIKVVIRADWDRSKVAIVSGGGAGHEPSHAGFVGSGMLTAAVSGEIFASPSVDAVLTAIRTVTGSAGCLLIVKNYTGDRLNFGLAAEKARAEGLNVEMVIVADDIALPDIINPRGDAGTLFVHKIAGYLSERGESLETIAKAARDAAKDIVSLGVSLSSCSIPGQAHSSRLADDEGELGLGIHGEPGVERFALQAVSRIVATMVERLSASMDRKADYAILINNLGGVSALEMGVVTNEVLQSPIGKRAALSIGPAAMMTALNMNGFSLSLIKLDSARKDALIAPVGPHAWYPAVARNAMHIVKAPPAPHLESASAASSNPALEATLKALCTYLVSLEAELNSLDAKTGDGDTGSTVAINCGDRGKKYSVQYRLDAAGRSVSQPRVHRQHIVDQHGWFQRCPVVDLFYRGLQSA
ncbi:MAG: dihydroxyacetone kinase DhaK [Pseudomonadota bacterium]